MNTIDTWATHFKKWSVQLALGIVAYQTLWPILKDSFNLPHWLQGVGTVVIAAAGILAGNMPQSNLRPEGDTNNGV